MYGMKLSGDVIKIRLKEHERLLGMREGVHITCREHRERLHRQGELQVPRMGSYGTRDGMVFYYMRDGDKVVTLNLRGHRYSKVMAEVEDKEAVAEAIRKSMQR
jgi:hypothetical protein